MGTRGKVTWRWHGKGMAVSEYILHPHVMMLTTRRIHQQLIAALLQSYCAAPELSLSTRAQVSR
jgi:hypothetical protein